jgi:hypothetical protein
MVPSIVAELALFWLMMVQSDGFGGPLGVADWKSSQKGRALHVAGPVPP